VGGLNERYDGTPPIGPIGTMLIGKNNGTRHNTFYIPYKPGTISAKDFEQAAVRALRHKGWNITEVSGTTTRAFYPRIQQRQLYKVEVILEPTRIAIRYRQGFSPDGDSAYLQHIRTGMMHELLLY
jgi:hypothetical protein